MSQMGIYLVNYGNLHVKLILKKINQKDTIVVHYYYYNIHKIAVFIYVGSLHIAVFYYFMAL